MATYLVVDESAEVPVIREAEATNIARLLDHLAPEPGDKLTIYRIAGPARTVKVFSRTDIEYSIE